MDDPPQDDWSRREVLKALAAGALGIPLAGCVTRVQSWTGARTWPPRLGDLPVGTAILLKDERAILWRDGQGLAALRATCPHRGCAVRVTGSFLVCPCHGSRFTRSGQLVRGPARRGLVWLRVTLDAGGRLTVHPEQVVPTGTYLGVS